MFDMNVHWKRVCAKTAEQTPTARWANVCFYPQALLNPPWPPPSCLWRGLLSCDAQTVPIACFVPFCLPSLSKPRDRTHRTMCSQWLRMFSQGYIFRRILGSLKVPLVHMSVTCVPIVMLIVRGYVLPCARIQAILNWLRACEQTGTGISTLSRLPCARARYPAGTQGDEHMTETRHVV